MDNRRRSPVAILRQIGWLLSVVALLFLGRWLWHVDHRVWAEMRSWRPAWLGVSLVLFQLWFYVRWLAWDFISQRHGYQHGRRANIRMWVKSELTRYIPGNVWSFATRYHGSVVGGSEKSAAVQAIILENLGLVGGALVVVCFLGSKPWLMAMAPVVVVAYALVIPRFLPILLQRWKPDLPLTAMPSSEAVRLVLHYAVSWVIFGLAHAAIYRAWPAAPAVSVWTLTGISVMAWLIGYISIVTPSGLGAREIAFVSLTRPFLSAGLASLFAIVSRVWAIVSEVVFLGIVMLFSRRR